ncbi:IS1595 family transposase [Massilia soli]|uniref:IS1595 family transposase n=1 Tax=Massilia soli TaxID=2792854 RepID=A0ABS7SIU4_9BURK|nr:IS1595 family transposase [Massilia soli]
MDARSFEMFTKLLSTLSSRQLIKVAAMLEHQSADAKTTALLEQAAAANLACPRCRSTKFYGHGEAHGLHRYRCRDCSKTFNSLTGTPLSRLRLKGKWLRYVDCLLMATTVRRAAKSIGVHKNTSFRWRHRFLTLPKTDRPSQLSGIAEADEIYFLESEKGARNLQRAPRKRGGSAKKRGTSNEQVCVLVARDRTGKTLDFVTGRGPVSKAQLRRCLKPVLAEDTLLVSDGNASYRYFARDAGISHEAVNIRQGVRVRGAIHVQNVNAYHSRFREWMSRFHGVATHYLPNYLGWRWAVDAQRIDTPAAMLMAALGVFPHLAGT